MLGGVAHNLDFLSPTLKSATLIESIGNKEELIMNSYDKQYWEDKVQKAFIKVFQLSKTLGVDALTFRINPGNSPFDPHHFRAFKFRQMSTHNQDLIETSKRFHAKYEHLHDTLGRKGAEVYVETLIKSLEELMNLRDNSGNIKRIGDADIQRVLKKNFGSDWNSVYQDWKGKNTRGMAGIANYQDTLDLIHQRRLKYMATGDYVDFMQTEYPNEYKKFHKNLLRRVVTIKHLVADQQDIDLFNKFFRGYTRVKF